MLVSVGYDKAMATLEVAFVEGGMYQYFRFQAMFTLV